MNRFDTALRVLLVIGACSPKPAAIQQPHPQPSDLLPIDTALARIQSDSALARIVDSLGLSVSRRWVCPMPVLRGDSSNDRRMVMGPPRFDPMLRLRRSFLCYNPLFRDSPVLPPNTGMKEMGRVD